MCSSHDETFFFEATRCLTLGLYGGWAGSISVAGDELIFIVFNRKGIMLRWSPSVGASLTASVVLV